MKNLKTLQFFLVVVMFLCFVLFLYNFITHVSYILPLVIMIIAFIGTMILSIIINKMDFDYKRLIKYENEDKIRIEAINNVENRLKKEGKNNTITYIEKNKLVEDEIDRLKKQYGLALKSFIDNDNDIILNTCNGLSKTRTIKKRRYY